MLERIAKPKVLIVAAILMTLFVLACLLLAVRAGWSTIRQRVQTFEPAPEPISFDYCGAELTELCVVSFGRDAFGSTIINLYVPLRKFPLFYLNIIRRSGESRYECEWNKNVRTSVYCVGDAIHLGEGLEMQVISMADDRLIATGPFILTAYLITTQIVDEGISASSTPEPDSTKPAMPAPTDTPEETDPAFTDIPTEELTETPEYTETETPEITETDSP